MNQKSQTDLDLLIIGGGPGGMSAALVAGRSLLKTVIINAENPRNMVTTASHGFLTRDGVHPLKLLEIAKQQLEKYATVTYIKGFVVDVEKVENRFRATTTDGNIFITDKIIFATGYKEDITKSNLPGIEKVYGKSVYPCPFCDGWEHRGQQLALFDDSGMGLEFAKVIAHWSNDLIVFTNGKQTKAEEKQLLEIGGVKVIEEAIVELIADENGHLRFVHLANNQKIEREAGFILNTHEEPATHLPEKLGVDKKLNDWDMETLNADESGRTNVEGIFIVGDAKSGFGGIATAVHDGAVCASTIVHEHVAAHWHALTEVTYERN